MIDCTSTRDWHEIDASGTPGDFVASGKAYPLDKFTLTGSQINLFVEAINPSASTGDLTISISVDIGTALPCLTDTVTLTAAEIEVHDLRHWEPSWDSATGVPRIQNPDLDATNPDSQVGGAITDGTSICLLRLAPTGLDWPGLSSSTLTIQKRSDTGLTDTRVIGNLETATTPNLPDLPNTITTGDVPQQAFSTGKLFYIPPDNYIDLPIGIEGPELNAWETCPMEFVLNGAGSTTLARIPFILRRPPLVLVHGILSSPATWDPEYWSEATENPIPTRIYKVHYSQTASLGYSENYASVVHLIDRAINEYREALDSNHHPSTTFDNINYAATRADVIGHSMGGQITRFYIAQFDTSQQSLPRSPEVQEITWDEIDVTRDQTSIGNNWPYLRDDNYGAGSIRRFITLGSPFSGSPYASLPAQYTEPNPWNMNLLNIWLNLSQPFKMPQSIEDILFPVLTGGAYLPPTCAADLSPDSAVQQLLEGVLVTSRLQADGQVIPIVAMASYPTGHRAVQWFSIVGESADNLGNAPDFTQLFPFSLRLFFSINDIGGGLGINEIFSPSHVLLLDDGDLIVGQSSQIGNIPPNVLANLIHYNHSHVKELPGDGETSSPYISTNVGILLSSDTSGITIPAQSDSNGKLINMLITDVAQFFPLTTGP